MTLLKGDPTKWSNRLKQFASNSSFLGVFDHFVVLGYKGLYNNNRVMPED